jgi:HEAT repeat protein
MINNTFGRRIVAIFLGLISLLASGCTDMPAWVPFQGARSDTLPGVVTPAEKITQLKKISSDANKGDPQAKKQIVEQLVAAIRSETDSLVRAEIIRTLGDYPDPSADSVLNAALKDPDVDVRIAACDAWGKRADAQAAVLLADVLSGDVNQDVRLAAARALGKNKDPKAVAALGEALIDSNPAMQYRAVLSLKESTGKDLGNNVDRWQQYVKEQHPQSSQPASVVERMKNNMF